MKIFAFLISLLFLFLFVSCKSDNKKSSQSISLNDGETIPLKRADMKKLEVYSVKAKEYCKRKNLNTNYFLLIDLSLHSGIKRFFIYNFSTKKIEHSFLVSHGCYKNSWGKDYSKENAIVSNQIDSPCSSIGKYIIGDRGNSNWGIGIKYLLKGQDSTNNNAEKRQIVLHSWNKVSNVEVFPNGTPEGWGCPAISDSAMRIVDAKLKTSSKNLLMWIAK